MGQVGERLRAHLDLAVVPRGQPSGEGTLVRAVLLVAIAGHPGDRLEHGGAVCNREPR